jgi:hypothetical protein
MTVGEYCDVKHENFHTAVQAGNFAENNGNSPKKSDDGCVKRQKCMEKPFGSHFKYQINYDF